MSLHRRPAQASRILRRPLIAAVGVALAVGAGVTVALPSSATTVDGTDEKSLIAGFGTSGDVVQLQNDVTIPDGNDLAVPANGSITLDLNSHKLTISGVKSGAGIQVLKGSSLTVEDTSSGGVLTVTGGSGSAGIGSNSEGDAGAVTIGSRATVDATGGNGGSGAAGIGGGDDGDSGTVDIQSGATVTATGVDYGSGIGSCASGTAGPVTIESGAAVTAVNGNDSRSAVGSGLDSGWGSVTNAGSLTIPAGAQLYLPFAQAGATNSGTIFNAGKVTGPGSVDNSGTIVNTGTVDAVITEHNYPITYDVNGGTGSPAAQTVYAKTFHDAKMELDAAPTPPAGDTFAGWFTAPSGGDPVDDTTDLSAIPDASSGITLHAQYASLTPGVGDVFVADAGGNRVVEIPAGGGSQVTLGTGLSFPTGVAVDPAGNVFVADSGNGRIVEEPAGGGPQTTAVAALNGPSGVALDAAGDLFVSEERAGDVVKVPAGGGAPVPVMSGLNGPQAVAADAAGDVFVADTQNGQVLEEPAGGGASITVASGLAAPGGVAVDAAGDVFVTQQSPGKVFEVPAGGGQPTVVASEPNKYVEGVALDATGDVFTAAFNDGGVAEYAAVGGAQSTLGGGLNSPAGLAVYAPPPSFVDDTPPPSGVVGSTYAGYTYQANSPAGETDATFRVATGALPPGLTLDPTSGELSGKPTQSGQFTFQVQAGNVATAVLGPSTTITVSSPAAFSLKTPGVLGAVGRPYSYSYAATPASGETAVTYRIASGALPTGLLLDPNTGVLSGTPTVAGTYTFSVKTGDGAGDVTTPATSITVEQPGTTFIGDESNGIGSVVSVPAGGGTPVPLAVSGLVSPQSMTLDATGDLFIADPSAARVVKVPADGSAQTTVGTGLNSPGGVAVDPAGDVFITDSYIPPDAIGPSPDDGKVVEVPAGGGPQTTVPGTDAALFDPAGLSVDVEGDLFIADNDDNQAVELPSGVDQTLKAISSDVTAPAAAQVDAAGDVFISDNSTRHVVEVPVGGGPEKTVGPVLGQADGLAEDASGNLFVADAVNADVVKIAPDGTSSQVASGFSFPTGVAVFAPPPAFTDDSPSLAATVGVPYTYTYQATSLAGEPDATFRLGEGYLPSGLSVDPTTGVLSGIPTQSGRATFNVQAGNASTGVLSQTVTIVVNIPVVVTVSGSQDYGATAPSFTTSQTLPSGLTLNGTVSCTTVDSGAALSPTLNVGSHTIDGSSCSGLSLSGPGYPHYTVVYSGSTFRAIAVVTADNETEVSGASDPDFTFTVAPAGVLTSPPTCGVSGPHTAVTTYPIVCSGAVAGNEPSVDYVDGTLTVTAAKNDAVLQVGTVNDRSGSQNLDGSTVKGAIFVFAQVPANDREVLFSLDGKVFHDEAAAPFDFNGTAVGNLATPFSTSSLADGAHSISARVTTSAGVVSTVSANFTVANNAPVANEVLQVSSSADRSSPQNLDGDETVSGPMYVFANVPSSDREVVFSLDGSPFHTEASAPFDFNGTATATTAYAYPSTSLSNGTHTISVTILDAKGNSSSSLATFTVANGGTAPPPAMSPLRVSTSADRSNPVNLDGATLTGTVYIFDVPTSTAYSVQFSLDGKAYHFESSAPFDFNGSGPSNALPYSLSALSKGKHTITATTALTNGKTETVTSTFTVS